VTTLISKRFDDRIAQADPACPFQLGLLGGTFDPLHTGHLALAQAAYANCGLDGVLFIPTGLPIRKLTTCVASPEDRYAMIEAAIIDVPHFDLTRLEIDRKGATYTIDTLRIMKEAYGNRAAFFFICSEDTTRDLITWKEPDAIAQLVTVLSTQRADIELNPEYESTAEQRFTVRSFEMPPYAVSSTMIRERVKQGLDVGHLLNEAVDTYIKEHRLYE